MAAMRWRPCILQVQELVDLGDIAISERDAVRIGAKCVRGKSFVCALRANRKKSNKICILATAQLIQHDAPDGNSVVIYVSKRFADGHREFGVLFREKCSVKVGHFIPDANNVSLRLMSQVDVQRVEEQRHLWATSLLLDICRQAKIIRLGELFKLHESAESLQVLVVGCEPVAQGLLSSTTTLKVLCPEESTLSQALSIVPSCDTNQNNFSYEETDRDAVTGSSGVPSAFYEQLGLFERIASLALNFIRSEDLGSRRILYISIVKFLRRLVSNEDCCLTVHIMPKALERTERDCSKTICPFNAVFVSHHVLEKLQVPDSSWVRVRVIPSKPSDESKIPAAMRLVQLCSVDVGREKFNVGPPEDPSPDVAYITPVLWFNLNAHPSNLLQPGAKLIIKKLGIFGDGRVDVIALPQLTKEIHVSVIVAPDYSAQYKYDSQLTNYFTVTRYLCKGDVFCILHKGTVVHFTVNSVGDTKRPNAPCVVNKEYTSLYQNSPVNGYVPATMSQFWAQQDWHPIWDVPFPSGIGQHVQKLLQLIVCFGHTRQMSSDAVFTACLSGPNGCGKLLILNCVARLLNLHLGIVNCWDLKSDSVGAMEAKIRNELKKHFSCSPCILVLKHVDALCSDKEDDTNGTVARVALALRKGLAEETFGKSNFPCCVIATTSNWGSMSIELATIFLHLVNIESPSLEDRCNIIEDLVCEYRLSSNVSALNLARLTAGFVLGDLCSLVSCAGWTAFDRWARLCGKNGMSQDDQENILAAGPMILEKDFEVAMQELQLDRATAIGAPEVPGVKWEDVGGLEAVKAEILNTIQLPLQHPELFSTGLRRSGVLLYGPPGTGKTLLAKTVATECSLNFLSVKGPELINMYVGQSEENVREVFQRAQSASPCVIFFDELDSLAPNRGHSGDSGGVMDRVVSQLLAELDGIQKSKNVYVMGATNRPDLLDPALLRPGRFDRLLFVGVSESSDSKLKILKALTRKFVLAGNVDLVELAEKCPPNLTGADLSALCTNALFNTLSSQIAQLDRGETASEDVRVTQDDFEAALKNLVPSVSEDDLLKYHYLQDKLLQ